MAASQRFASSTSAGAMEDRSAQGRSSVRSCTTCSKAKAKCVRRAAEHVCERCARLQKECHSKDPVLRKRKTLKTSRAAQLEKLEHKIEHLVNALSSANQPLLAPGQPSPPLSQPGDTNGARQRTSEVLESLCVEMGDDTDDADESQTASQRTTPIAAATAGTWSTQTSNQVAAAAEDQELLTLGVTLSEAEVLLDRFRRLMAPALPFVIISPDMTAVRMYAERPFLLHAIVTSASYHDLVGQQAMVKHLMRDVSERILLNNEKNIGILQGLLVFIGWYHPHIFWGQQVTNLLHLAIAMTIDLGIDRVNGACGADFKTATHKVMPGPTGPKHSSREPTLEDHRVLAGVFYLTSMLASSFKKIDALSYTKYLDDRLQDLEREREYDSDLFLVQMVRLQHLAEDTQTTETPTAPMAMYVKSFRADLSKLRENDPCKDILTPSANVYLEMQYLTAEILVYELALNDLQDTSCGSIGLQLTNIVNSKPAMPLRSHLDDLYNCIDAIKRFISVYFSIPTSQYLLLPFSAFGQFAHAFIVLTKIASLDIEGWDLRTAYDSIDFVSVIEQSAVRFEAAGKEGPEGLPLRNESFGKWALRIRWMKQVYEAKFNPQAPPTNTLVADVASDRSNLMHRQDAVRTLFRPPAEYDPETIAAAQQGYPLRQQTPAAVQQQQPTPALSEDAVLSGDFFNYLDNDFWSSFPAEYDLGFGDPMMGSTLMSP